MELLDYIIGHLEGVNTISITVRLGLATLCGGAIGTISSRKGKAAGLKTHILVCLGATLVMLTNQYIFTHLTHGVGDPSRMGAQVINGIGFLGAGTILVTGRQQIRGLTTAAGLWAAACMGLAIGIGFYNGAIIGCIFIVVTITLFQRINNIVSKNSKAMDLYIEVATKKEIKQVINILKQHHCKIENVEIEDSKYGDPETIGLFLAIGLQYKRDHEEIIAILEQYEGIHFIEEVH